MPFLIKFLFSTVFDNTGKLKKSRIWAPIYLHSTVVTAVIFWAVLGPDEGVKF